MIPLNESGMNLVFFNMTYFVFSDKCPGALTFFERVAFIRGEIFSIKTRQNLYVFIGFWYKKLNEVDVTILIGLAIKFTVRIVCRLWALLVILICSRVFVTSTTIWLQQVGPFIRKYTVGLYFKFLKLFLTDWPVPGNYKGSSCSELTTTLLHWRARGGGGGGVCFADPECSLVVTGNWASSIIKDTLLYL